LGGPLLNALFSDGMAAEIRARLPPNRVDALHSGLAPRVREVYRQGIDRKLWRDAEQFIDYLDTGAEDRDPGKANPHRDVVRTFIAGDFDDMRGLSLAARRIVAAECCAFLEGVDVQREQWLPFHQWADGLTPSDTVITFNYDRVVEELTVARGERVRKNGPADASNLRVLLPGDTDDPGDWKGSTPVLKLHGSIDWRKETVDKNTPGERIVVDRRGPLFALDCDDERIAIATPGPSKRRQAQGFSDLWTLARRALGEAHTIVFVGYRFPETDADARDQLLKAIAQTERKPTERAQSLALHIVLGQGETSSRDSARLQSLLRFVCGRTRTEVYEGNRALLEKRGLDRFTVTAHPLFAQDFFSVARREDLVKR
jgi:SIR2-like domain